jgi:hypothetical protein
MFPDITERQVIVVADGVTYAGRLVEMTETAVEIATETQWVSLPMDKISDIKERS